MHTYAKVALFALAGAVVFEVMRRQRRAGDKYKAALQRVFTFVKKAAPTSREETEAVFAQRSDFFKNLLLRTGLSNRPVKWIHVAGTKGKGSVCEYLRCALVANGRKVGVFTSPHMHTARERIRVNNTLISQDDFARFAEAAVDLLAGEPWAVFFDLLLVMAILYFAEQGVEFVILETGVGGRYDSTNFLQAPTVSIITSISIDHQTYLGTTLEQIAWQKAGIIKNRTATFTTTNQSEEVLQVLRQEAVAKHATLYEVEPRRSALRAVDGRPSKLSGRVQEENLHIAMVVVSHLKLLPKGFDRAYWPCRLETFTLNHVPVVIDGAHNEDSMFKLLAEVRTRYPGAELWAVFGAGKDKNVDSMINRVAEDVDRVMIVQSAHFGSMSPTDLAQAFPSDARMYKLMIKDPHGMTVAEGLSECISQASVFRTRQHLRESKLTKSESRAQLQSLQAQADSVVLVVCGSLFVAAEAREFVFANNPRAFMPDDWVRSKDPIV